jgi:hypothetical protein
VWKEKRIVDRVERNALYAEGDKCRAVCKVLEGKGPITGLDRP